MGSLNDLFTSLTAPEGGESAPEPTPTPTPSPAPAPSGETPTPTPSPDHAPASEQTPTPSPTPAPTPSPAPSPSPASQGSDVDPAMIELATQMGAPDPVEAGRKMQAYMGGVVQNLVGRIPEVVKHQVAQAVDEATAAQEFYGKNPDLAGHGDLVMVVASKLQTENPNMKRGEFFEEVAKRTKKQLGIIRDGSDPSLPVTPGGGGGPSRVPTETPQQMRDKDIALIMNRYDNK